MIGYLSGEILTSDGDSAVVKTASGIGYQVYFQGRVESGQKVGWYISFIVRENGHFLYAFPELRDKKLFEALVEIKGVGPKSAYALWGNLGFEDIVFSLQREDKKKLTQAPGIGPKAAAQILLDFGPKSQKLAQLIPLTSAPLRPSLRQTPSPIISDALMAFAELGFREEKVGPVIQRLMEEYSASGRAITKAEHLVELALKEL